MKRFSFAIRPFIGYATGFFLLVAAVPASAQDNFDQGKTGAQLFASDCAICHKSVQGLNKDRGAFGLGLESFLREHYTASRESAAILARYIQSADSGPAPGKRGARRNARGSDKPKAERRKSGAASVKPDEAKSDVPAPKPETKSETAPEAKPADSAKPDKQDKSD